MKKTEKQEKPKPKRCVCGVEAITIEYKGKKMITCSNPERCAANLRTMWNSSADAAVTEWNGLIESFYSERRNKKRGDGL